MDQLMISRPGWLDWSWALNVLAREVRLTGEDVRLADGVVATPYLLADGPLAVTVGADGPHLAVTPSAPWLGELVACRFHLGLDEAAVSGALSRSELPGGIGAAGWVRRPAAAALWSYCLIFLCGGDPDAAPVRQIFAELGRPADPLAAGRAASGRAATAGQADAGQLRIAPEPADLLTAGDRRLISCGVAPHRAANVLSLARAFAARPDRYDEVSLRALPGEQAVARLAELPHIGATRSREIASTALGHDDVLPDLARRGEQLRRKLGLSWSQVRASAPRTAPYRSILGDTLLDLLSD